MRTQPSSSTADLTPRFYPFWSINGPLDQARLRQQMRDFQRAGMDGVVFHPRYYPGQPPYMGDVYLAEVSAAILYAKEIGLHFWLYDENGWPSGTADGQLLARYPASAAVRLDLFAQPVAGAIGTFHVDAANELVSAGTPGARTWHLAPRPVEGIDSLNPEVMHQFLGLIHERYRDRLAPAAWDYVEAFFTDEPESGTIKPPMPETAGAPWSPVLAKKLRRRFGDDYPRLLPLLFARGEGAGAFRVAYWELVTDAFAEGFLAPYRAWCDAHGKKFLGHIKGEEHPLFQLPMGGSFHRLYRQFSHPGIDSLERHPSLDFYPRQAASVARQFGDGRCMVEAFGGAGWGAAPADLERYLLWLGRNGLTDFVMHLSQYRLDSAAIQDWPPSEPLHLTWREAYPEVLRRVKAALAAHPPAAADTLVVAPYRGLMAVYDPAELLQTNQHNASTFPDTPASRLNTAFLDRLAQLKAAGIAYDVTDERTLEEDGAWENGGVRLGRMRYARLIVDPGADLRGPAAQWPRSRVEIPAAVSAPEMPLATPAPAVSGHVADVPLAWKLSAAPRNAWLLEVRRGDDGAFHGSFSVDFDDTALARPPHLQLEFADDLREAWLEDQPLALAAGLEGPIASLPPLFTGTHRLRFRCARDVPRPFVWLIGEFALESQSGWSPGPNGTQRTRGPFIATTALKAGATVPGALAVPSARDSADSAHVRDLVTHGFPFLRVPLVIETHLTLNAPAAALRLHGIAADAAHVFLDDRDLGWTWAPDWELRPSEKLTAGEHRLRLELIPSTFNTFGPHHYVGGDGPVISPDQFTGVKNFADAPAAPSPTHVPDWHFKSLRPPTHASLT